MTLTPMQLKGALDLITGRYPTDCEEADACTCIECRVTEAVRPFPEVPDRLAAIDKAVSDFLGANRRQNAALSVYRESRYHDEMAAQDAEDAYREKLKAADRIADLLGVIVCGAARKE